MTNQEWIACLLEEIAFNTSITQLDRREFLDNLRGNYAHTRSEIQGENNGIGEENPPSVRRRGRPRGKKSENRGNSHASGVQSGSGQEKGPEA